jgi:hypothetical protein
MRSSRDGKSGTVRSRAGGTPPGTGSTTPIGRRPSSCAVRASRRGTIASPRVRSLARRAGMACRSHLLAPHYRRMQPRNPRSNVAKLSNDLRARPDMRAVPPDTCLAPHVAMMRATSEKIQWHDGRSVAERVRIGRWTCPCKATVYELCTVGGIAFIRRTIQDERGPRVHETSRMLIRKADALWDRLLRGEAR